MAVGANRLSAALRSDRRRAERHRDASHSSLGTVHAGSPQVNRTAGRSGRELGEHFIQGKADMVDVVTAVAESETALETLVAVRDRVIAAYEEVMRMTV